MKLLMMNITDLGVYNILVVKLHTIIVLMELVSK